MNESLKNRLVLLAQKYETPAFLQKDPSRFMHGYSDAANQELVAFIAANLAFGRREQILSHVEYILDKAGANPVDWVLNGGYETYFPCSDNSFYRMYSYQAMRIMFDTLRALLRKGSLGCVIKDAYEQACGNSSRPVYLFSVISSMFPKECTLIAHCKSSSAKKLNMFLRWMVRDGSPVDLGLWGDWYSKARLLMPLDTHVMQEATKLGLLESSCSGAVRAASLKTALELTKEMEAAFPGDPVRGDFALFGLGVDSGQSVET